MQKQFVKFMKMTTKLEIDKKIKILFFIPRLSEGGAEKVMCNLVNNMDQSKFDITVQTIDLYKSEQYLAEGIRYKAVNRCSTWIGKKVFSYWFRLCAELKTAYYFFIKDDYDIEVAYLETVATKIIAQSTNRKAVKLAWVHCDLSKKEGMRSSVKKVKKQYAKFDKIVCVSRDVEKGFCHLLGNDFDTSVMQNVIDEKEIINNAEAKIELETESDLINLLAVGRLSQEKNYAHLIETCSWLRTDGYKFRLNILGEGPERNSLEEQIKELMLENYVTLRGFIKNPYPWMKKSDILVCSSAYEGSSTVVQEALILGTIVVTTPCGGMKDLLGNSEYGLIVEDSKKGLYNGLKRLMSDSDFKQKYKIAAAERGSIFSEKKAVSVAERFFENMVAR